LTRRHHATLGVHEFLLSSRCTQAIARLLVERGAPLVTPVLRAFFEYEPERALRLEIVRCRALLAARRCTCDVDSLMSRAANLPDGPFHNFAEFICDGLKSQLRRAKASFDAFDARIDAMNVESILRGRLMPMSEARARM